MPPTGFKSGRLVYNLVEQLINGSTVNNRAVTSILTGTVTTNIKTQAQLPLEASPAYSLWVSCGTQLRISGASYKAIS